MESFDKLIRTSNSVYLAVSRDIPVLGEQYYCATVAGPEETNFAFLAMRTSPICKIVDVGNNIFLLVTQEGIFIVLVKPVTILEPEPSELVYLAISGNVPVLGESYCCSRVVDAGGNEYVCKATQTNPIRKIVDLGNNIFKLMTAHSMYIVKVYP